MANFPSLSVDPDEVAELNPAALDPTIRTPTESGHEITRAAFTRLRREWRVIYSGLTTADKAAIESFLSTVGVGADSFNWTHPEEGGAAKVVRFVGAFVLRRWHVAGFYSCDFTVREV
jgi:phage-related protein